MINGPMLVALSAINFGIGLNNMAVEMCPILCKKCQEYFIDRLGMCNRCLREEAVFYKQVQEDAQKYDQQQKQIEDKRL